MVTGAFSIAVFDDWRVIAGFSWGSNGRKWRRMTELNGIELLIWVITIISDTST